MTNQDILLTTQQFITLGHRVSAVQEIIEEFNSGTYSASNDVYRLLAKELDTIATILMSVDDKDDLEDLGINTKEINA